MKQIFTVFKFELYSYLKNKSFLIGSLILLVVVAVGLSIPRGLELFKNDDNSEQLKKYLLVDNTFEDKNATAVFLSEYFDDVIFEIIDSSQEEIISDLQSGNYYGAIILNTPTSYTYIVETIAIQDRTAYILNYALSEKLKVDSMVKLGVSEENAFAMLSTEIKSEVINIGKNQTENYLYTYILIFALYMAIILYGQLVSTSVATEKSSRTMEMLITSANPSSLIFGQVLGAGTAGLLQLVSLLATSFIFFNLNKPYLSDNHFISSIFDMPLEIIFFTVIFFSLGFFIYAFLFGAGGSLVSKVEDIGSTTTPIVLIFIGSFLAVSFSMNSGNVDSLLMKILSFIPLTSPIAMFVRIAMGEVSTVAIVISISILILSTIGIGVLAAKIYRVGVLMYGTTPKLSAVIKAMKKQ